MKQKKNTMIRNFKDLKEQSKIMDNMSTNQEVKKSGKIPDPIQNTKKR